MLSLRRIAAAGIAFALALIAVAADAQRGDQELRRPQRLTVGVADDLLGQLSRDGKTLYFVSNRDTTNQIFAQSLADGRARQLFDDDADVTWPRVSPDGLSLLYISFRENASGQLCIRRLPDGEARRCLPGSAAALQAEWIDSGRIALVSRQSIKGDLQVLDVTVGPNLSARPLFERNLTSPTVSPDGRWLVYVPVERTVASVGPAFAAHAALQLEAVRLGASTPPVRIAFALPGQTGQPVFARDGRSLYVVQFFTDTNHDGVIDASDHGVLFRVPISLAGDTPVVGAPEQLTETSWNCEYPAPFTDRLIATCSQDASLDVYSLPLDGEVPAEWTAEILASEIDNAGSRAEQQLLASRRLALEKTATGRRRAMLALALLHLQLEEFRAAEFYAQEVDTLRDDATAGISLPLRTMVEQRRASRRREQGRMMEGFVAEARKRLEKLHPEAAESPMAEDLLHLVRSEIADAIGDKALARAELVAVTVDETTPAPIVEAYYQYADAFYREVDDREALISTCRQLSANVALPPDRQLRYARAAVRAMVRGLPHGEADARLAQERAGATSRETELVFAIDLARIVLAIRDPHPPASVTTSILALYAAQTRPGRRRALMNEAEERADDVDADELQETLAARDITDVKRGTRERRNAERLFGRMFIGRAYERAAAKRYDDARADFDSVAEQTGSYEAVVGAIDMRLRKGERPADVEAFYEKRGAAPALSHFARAYLLARQLPKLEGEAHRKTAAAAMAALDSSWSELKEQRIAQALFGALLHEEYLMTGDLGTAERANVHYLVALELVSRNARFRAMILGELGFLHTDVGNYRIALGYLLDRDKLPYADNTEGLDSLLSKSETLLHVGRDGEAATAAEAAIAMINRNPMLAPYRLLALDWAAVNNLAAEHFDRALALYDEEMPLLEGSHEPLAERNRIAAHVSRAAAAVGAGKPARALPDLDYVDAHLGDPSVPKLLVWPHATPEHVVRTYRLIAAGLRANACRELGQLDAEALALEARRAILEEQFGETVRIEIEEQQMLVEAQLALNGSQRRDATAAGAWLTKALVHGDELRARSNGVTDRAQLDVLRLAAQLTTSMHAPLVVDLSKRIEAASVELAGRRDPALRIYERWFEIYGPLVSPTATGPTPVADGATHR
jgi:hypothetical protein